MRISDFNELGVAEATEAVRTCVAIDDFAPTLVAGRPYADLDGLLTAASGHARAWTTEQVEAALADHPRIGERATGRARDEQAGVGEDRAIRDRLRAGNLRYEERFGRIYLVRAAGRSGEELLALLEERLSNDPETELRVTHEQLAEITLLRLEDRFT